MLRLQQLVELDPEKLIAEGKKSLRWKQQLIDTVLETSFEVDLGEGKFGKCLVGSKRPS